MLILTTLHLDITLDYLFYFIHLTLVFLTWSLLLLCLCVSEG